MLAVLVLLRVAAGAGWGDEDLVIALRTAAVDTRVAASVARLRRAANDTAADAPGWEQPGAQQLLVRMRDDACARAALEPLLAGGRVLYHVSRCAFAVLVAGRAEALALADARGVAWAGPMLPRYKLAPELLAARRCPLQVQLELPVCPPGAAAPDAAAPAACALSGREWAARHAARWARDLRLVGAEARSATSVVVQCRDGDAVRVARALAAEEHVHWVDRHRATTMRNKHAAYNARETELKVEIRGVWARGIDGSGEVLHVADSGVDVGHCFFHDAATEVPYNKVDAAHRKVVAYWTGRTGDRYDAKQGHGTHVAATIAGSLVDQQNSAGQYQGIAPGAKLAITDAEIQTQSDGDGEIIFGDIVADIFAKPLADAGAALQSHSWGTQEYTYTPQSANVDKFLRENREALFVWAAGNDGGDKPMQTIGSPATAKNCLTVGATLAGIDAAEKVRAEGHDSLPLNQQLLQDEPDIWSNAHVQHFSGRGPCSDGRLKPDIVLPGLVQSASSNGRSANSNCCLNPGCALHTRCPADCSQQGQCIEEPAGVFQCKCQSGYCGRDCSIKTDTPTPMACCRLPALGENYCTSGSNGQCRSPLTGIPSSYTFGACECDANFAGVYCEQARLASLVTTPKMGTSMAAPVAAGMAALARQYFRQGFYPTGIANVADAFTPSGALLKAMLLTAAVEPKNGAVVQVFESRELAASGRLNSFLAQVTSDCNRLREDRKEAAFCSAINSSMTSFPNVVQGFGRPLIENVLFFSRPAPQGAHAPSAFNLFVSDDLSATNNSVHSFCLYYPPGVAKSPLVATLTWMDPEASPAAQRALVNDLDLEVQDTCNFILTGNSGLAHASKGSSSSAKPTATSTSASTASQDTVSGTTTATTAPPYPTAATPVRDGRGRLKDRVNNVERVILQDGGLGCGEASRTVRVLVHGHYVPDGPQPFALAVTSGSALSCVCPRLWLYACSHAGARGV